jgi:hypothetical protein
LRNLGEKATGIASDPLELLEGGFGSQVVGRPTLLEGVNVPG